MQKLGKNYFRAENVIANSRVCVCVMCAHPSNKDVAEAIVGHFSVPSSSKVGRDESLSSVFFFVFLVQTVL